MDLKVAVTGHKNQVRGKSSAWFAHFNVHQLRSCDFGWISLCISAIIVLGINGAQNFLQRHRHKLSEASILGRFFLGLSVLPVFLLTSAFKIGLRIFVGTWDYNTALVVSISLVGLPNLSLLILKMCKQCRDLTFAYVNQNVIADILGLHLWPKSRDGKRIGLAMTVFTFLALGLPGLFVIESPEPTPRSWMAELNRTEENKTWSLATGERLRFASVAYLVISHIAFIFAIYLILLEHVWVDYVLKLDPLKLTQSDIVSSL